MAEYRIREAAPGEIAHYTPYGGAAEFLKCQDPEAIIHGMAETGKTLAACWKLHLCACKYPNSSIVILRKTLTSTYSTVLQTFQRKVLGILGEAGPTPGYEGPVGAYGGEKPQWYDYPNGSRIWICGMDKSTKILSAEHDIIYVNQAEELSLAEWETLTTRATGRAGNMPYAQTIGDMNPAWPTHWVYKRVSLTLFQSYRTENPVLYDQETGEITEQGRRTELVLDGLTGVRRARLRDGRPALAEGAVYPMWNSRLHVIDPFRIPDEWRRFRVVDFGFNNPFVCYDDMTEVLTEQGWMKFKSVPDGVRLATVGVNTKAIEYQMPTVRIVQRYIGPMVMATAGAQPGVNFCVTPNHRMVIESRRTGKWKYARADTMPAWGAIPTGSAGVKCDDDPIFQVPYKHERWKLSPVKLSLFAEFLGWWIGDGSLLHTKAGHYVRIAQKVDRERLECCLDSLGWHYTAREGKDGVYDYRIQSTDLYRLLEPFRAKRIPSWALAWPRPALEALFVGLIASDGPDRPNATLAYYTTRKELADDVQWLAVLLGRASVIGKQRPVGFTGKPVLNYVVRFHKFKRAIVARLKVETVNYDGTIYCFEVPNSTLVVRRNARPMVCGNCHWWAVGPDGDMYRYREIYMSKRTVRDHAEHIKALSVGEPIETTVCDWDAEGRATLEENGIATEQAIKDVQTGIQAVQARLDVNSGRPGLFYFLNACVETDERMEGMRRPTCTEDEYPGYVWAPSDGKEEKEVPVKKDDHGLDGTRYAVMYVEGETGGTGESYIIEPEDIIDSGETQGW